ncbi:MAG: bifunctional diguanylate cyclase/phosphodiesterase [Sulfurovum sp.]|nr:bifunctional diguanylate cyclase/phosphodiesterase [Sulfurovum sp.]NNJ45685.1 bifunctional diguanylate cyclase/phosphodiesterase [Sulfurovum sp.]
MRSAYIDKFIIFLMFLLISFALFLQVTTVKSTEKLKNEEIKKAEQYVSKIAQLIQIRTKNNIEFVLTKYPLLREYLNESLQAFLTTQYQYIFVLHKDAKGKYRFLLDGSKEEPEEYKAIFFPKSKLFDRVYETQKMQIIEQHEGVEQVWLSLVYPIVIKNKTEALLVLDLSESYGEHLNNFNSPLMMVVWMMQVFLLISLFLLIFLAYRYYKIRKKLIIDDLTSVYKKQYLQEFFNKHRIDNYNVMLLDIDEFKEINQKFGYESGDMVLKEFTQTLSLNLSSNTLIVRTAGAEFLIVSPKEEGIVEEQAQKIFDMLKDKKYLIGNEVQYLTVSMSAMSVPDETTLLETVERLLDEKLLEVKSSGKNDLAILSDTELSDGHYNNIDYIKEALEEERLTCIYQPIYETETKQIVKYEALVRLIDKDDPEKLITPFHFMKFIRGTSQYIKMSKLVLREVFKTLETYKDVEISVNLDLDDLDNADMMKLITHNLYENRAIANRLTFEILEEHEVTDYGKVMFYLQQLKAFGSKIALDDFGSGYASYSYLIKLNIDILKIDGSIIQELKSTPHHAKTVITSIRELAESFQYELVAEFVSDEDIYTIIKELGISYAQGYYLGEPKPIEWYIRQKD